jgi:hypothetical protein
MGGIQHDMVLLSDLLLQGDGDPEKKNGDSEDGKGSGGAPGSMQMLERGVHRSERMKRQASERATTATGRRARKPHRSFVVPAVALGTAAGIAAAVAIFHVRPVDHTCEETNTHTHFTLRSSHTLETTMLPSSVFLVVAVGDLGWGYKLQHRGR